MSTDYDFEFAANDICSSRQRRDEPRLLYFLTLSVGNIK
jgi:hypothetical protein